jgi:hypothetical protein
MSYRKHDDDMMAIAARSLESTQIVPDWQLIGHVTVTTWSAWNDDMANIMSTAVLATCLGVRPGDEAWQTVMMELPRQRLALIRDMLHKRWGILGWKNGRYGELRSVTICLPDIETRALYEMLRSMPSQLNWRVEMYVRQPVRM